MIEVHTKLECKCGKSFHHMMTGDIALASRLRVDALCPFCGELNQAEYEFSAEFPCIKKWKFWSKKHFIVDHFTCNEGTLETEIFPRKCFCGKEILLKQRRIL